VIRSAITVSDRYRWPSYSNPSSRLVGLSKERCGDFAPVETQRDVSCFCGRPLREIAMEPSFIAAAVAGMIAYGVMSLVMTATPIAMLDCRHEFAAAAFVIQWHSLGMFAPSFVTGHPEITSPALGCTPAST
jgi:hypothetical protein